jgi:hypothetical protein
MWNSAPAIAAGARFDSEHSQTIEWELDPAGTGTAALRPAGEKQWGLSLLGRTACTALICSVPSQDEEMAAFVPR